MAMTVNHIKKTIVGESCEMAIIANYIEHCIAPSDRKNWKVTIQHKGVPEDLILYRSKKS